uniref:Uncharacterized protein n=1 Tax=viral metagenome TaxID=1070528 RepID=A0A6M3JXT4_9ZZZZ
MMEDLIKALTIFLKYKNSYAPTHCEHDILYVNINPEIVSKEDKLELNKLGFEDDEYTFYSFRFGSS